MNREPQGRLLIVDRDVSATEALSVALQTEGYLTICCRTARQAIEALKSSPFDLVLSDFDWRTWTASAS
jgi:DNA-binding NtrC family response regulator